MLRSKSSHTWECIWRATLMSFWIRSNLNAISATSNLHRKQNYSTTYLKRMSRKISSVMFVRKSKAILQAKLLPFQNPTCLLHFLSFILDCLAMHKRISTCVMLTVIISARRRPLATGIYSCSVMFCISEMMSQELLEYVMDHFDMSCDHCETMFESFSDAKRHYLREHSEPKGYIKCCGKKMRSLTNIEEHIEGHKNPNSLK